MYDHDVHGSNISFFDDLVITAGSQQPSQGGQFIEAKNSGSCFLRTSSFTLTFSPTGDSLVFSDSDKNWSCTGQPSYINVNINDSSNPGIIIVTFSNP